jgi:hypothetical protein
MLQPGHYTISAYLLRHNLQNIWSSISYDISQGGEVQLLETYIPQMNSSNIYRDDSYPDIIFVIFLSFYR